jgi:RNA polymerase sigma-70 factor (ECF subfamily)
MIVDGNAWTRRTVMPVTKQRAEAVLDLFEAYYHRVFCFARRSLPGDEAEDIAQDVFTRLLELRHLEEIEISVSYLIKIADNLIKRRYNRNQRFVKYLKAIDSPRRFQRIDECTESELPIEILDRLGELSPQERTAVDLVVCRGLSYREAAAALGAPVSSVNNWKYRGLQRLKEEMPQPGHPRVPVHRD